MGALKMCECFQNVSALKMEMGYVWKMSKELVDGMDVCVRSMGELVPAWLSVLGVVHLVN
jgi:hypothetical protein